MWGELIGAGSTLLGSALNSANQNDINQQNADLQREFAQNSIQWRVQDAQKAGIHPLAALGAAGYNASPSFVGADNGIAQAGQQISQGLARQLEDDFSEKSKLELERAKLENLKLQKEINAMGQGGVSGLFGGDPAGVGAPLSITGGQDWINSNVGREQGIKLEAQPTPGRATLLPNPDSFTGQTAQENFFSRMLTHVGNYSDLAFTDLLHNLRKSAKLPKDKSLIWYPGVSGPVLLEVSKNTAKEFDKYTDWLKKFNPSRNYFTNGEFAKDVKKFIDDQKKNGKIKYSNSFGF